MNCFSLLLLLTHCLEFVKQRQVKEEKTLNLQSPPLLLDLLSVDLFHPCTVWRGAFFLPAERELVLKLCNGTAMGLQMAECQSVQLKSQEQLWHVQLKSQEQHWHVKNPLVVILFWGHTKILLTLIGMGTAAAGKVSYPGKATQISCKG